MSQITCIYVFSSRDTSSTDVGLSERQEGPDARIWARSLAQRGPVHIGWGSRKSPYIHPGLLPKGGPARRRFSLEVVQESEKNKDGIFYC